MLRSTKIVIGFLGVFMALLIIGCYKDKTVVSDTGEEITRTVSFNGEIIPIFNNSCAISGCHVSGGKAPDLSATNAYNSLKNNGYVNAGEPVSSSLYLWMTGKKSTPMPLTGPNKNYNALVLAWLKQGAQNN